MNRKRKLKIANNFKTPAVFLDRDGTINYDDGYTYKFSKLRFRPHVLKGLRYITKKKYFILSKSWIDYEYQHENCDAMDSKPWPVEPLFFVNSP